MSLHRLKLLISLDSARSSADRITFSFFAAACVGSAGLVTYLSTSTEQYRPNESEDDIEIPTSSLSKLCCADKKSSDIKELPCHLSCPTPPLDSMQRSHHVFATSPTSEDDGSSRKKRPNDEPSNECDFAIVGYGNAGSAAVASLKKLCPRASMAIIDPIGVPSSGYVERQGEDFARKKEMRVKYFPLSTERLDHKNRTLTLSNGTQIRFKQSVLLATGSRGAPPPISLMDQQAMERVLELRSTELPTGNDFINFSSPRRPVLSPHSVRQLSIMAAAQGARVCVLGSGIEAVELAVAAAYKENKTMTTRRIKRKNAGKNEEESSSLKVALVFGNAGPLSTRLPRYLSTAVSKRLRQHNIDVQERSLVRYVAMAGQPLQAEDTLPCLEVHTAKSYDTLDTARRNTDLLVVAPSVDGQMGTAVVPIVSRIKSEIDGDVWIAPSYEPWSNLITSNQRTLSCYVDDGRIVVNKELNAASRVFAAGSVARHPGGSGHATVSGEGFLDGRRAGEVAAHNMAKEYFERRRKGCNGKMRDARIFSEESFPIWRTDVCSYATNESADNKSIVQSHLSSVGVNALCIGHCDSETMSTHGLWWTNQSSDSRKKLALSEKLKAGTLTTRRSTKRSSANPRPVYGSGIVYYLDRSGTIRGIMTWGLPFTQSGGTDLNNDLVARMKAVLASNGKICLKQHHNAVEQHGGGKQNSGLLTAIHLSEESKLLVSIALSGSNEMYSGLFFEAGISEIAKPLHRYVPSKPSQVTSIGVLKRSADDIGTGGIGEDIFVRNHILKDTARPQSLVYVYPMEWTNHKRNNSVDEGGRAKEELQPQGGNEAQVRSRPPKEEPIWLRRGESNKTVSMNDTLADVFRLNVHRGRFSDGSDAVVQAPVPRVIQDARKRFFDFKSGSSPDKDQDRG